MTTIGQQSQPGEDHELGWTQTQWRQRWWGFSRRLPGGLVEYDDPDVWLARIVVSEDGWQDSQWCAKHFLNLVTWRTDTGSKARKGNPPCRRYDCRECAPLRAAWWLWWMEQIWPDEVWVTHLPADDRHDTALGVMKARSIEYFSITRDSGETTFFSSNDPRGDGVRGHLWVAKYDGRALLHLDALAVFAYAGSVPGLSPGCYSASDGWRPRIPKGKAILLDYGPRGDRAHDRLANVLHQRTGVVLGFRLEKDCSKPESERRVLEYLYPPDLHREFERIVRYVNAMIRAEREELKIIRAAEAADPWGCLANRSRPESLQDQEQEQDQDHRVVVKLGETGLPNMLAVGRLSASNLDADQVITGPAVGQTDTTADVLLAVETSTTSTTEVEAMC